MKTSTKENMVTWIGASLMALIVVFVVGSFCIDIKNKNDDKATMVNLGKAISVEYLQGNFSACSKTIITTEKGKYVVYYMVSVENGKDVIVSKYDIKR